MSRQSIIRRWFRFSLRKLLIAVAVVALSLFAVPTGIHWWTWASTHEAYRQAIDFEIDKNMPKADSRGMMCGTNPYFTEACLFYVEVRSVRNGDVYLPIRSNQFRVTVESIDRVCAFSAQCGSVEDAMKTLRNEHWKYHMNWGPRLADRISRWWRSDEEPEIIVEDLGTIYDVHVEQ